MTIIKRNDIQAAVTVEKSVAWSGMNLKYVAVIYLMKIKTRTDT